MAYDEFADVYDLFNDDADYDALFDYVQTQLHTQNITNGIIADLGCGTGELTLRLAEAGYDMIGIDLSSEMLCVLREKAAEAQIENLLLLNQDITQLDLFGTVRGVISTFDTFNHISPDLLQKTICRAALFLEKDGVFLFDMNTLYKHESVLANNTFEIEADDALCVWKNSYDAENMRTFIEIAVTYEDGEQFTESFYEYAYSRAQIEAMCDAAGLKIVSICDGESFSELRKDSQRFFFTAVKL